MYYIFTTSHLTLHLHRVKKKKENNSQTWTSGGKNAQIKRKR